MKTNLGNVGTIELTLPIGIIPINPRRSLIHCLNLKGFQVEWCKILGTSAKKTTGKCGNFSQIGDPPLPPVWEFFPDFIVYFWEVSHVKNSKNMEVGFG